MNLNIKNYRSRTIIAGAAEFHNASLERLDIVGSMQLTFGKPMRVKNKVKFAITTCHVLACFSVTHWPL
jgi:hypothetical protein